MVKDKKWYKAREKNAVSVCILKTWLRNAGIEVLVGEPGADLVVTTVTKDKLKVVVRDSGEANDYGESGVLNIRAKSFTTRRIDDAINDFYRVQMAAGYLPVKPPFRDGGLQVAVNGNAMKAHYKNEDFLVSVRHQEFRRAPNPPDSVWKQYDSVMKEAVWAFMHMAMGRNTVYDICARHGLDMGDLLTYARVYVCNFTSRYETDKPVNSDNERLCYKYIKQRLRNDFLPVLLKKERSVLPDSQTVQVALLGTVSDMAGTQHEVVDPESLSPRRASAHYVSPSTDPTDSYIEAIDNPRIVEIGRNMVRFGYLSDNDIVRMEEFENNVEKTIPRNQVLDTTNESVRKKSAGALLDQLLGQLPHQQFVESLHSIWVDQRRDSSTRNEAGKRLQQHAKKCDDCQQNQGITDCLSRPDLGRKRGVRAVAA